MEPTIVQWSVIVVDLDDKEYTERKIFVVRTADMIAAVKESEYVNMGKRIFPGEQ